MWDHSGLRSKSCGISLHLRKSCGTGRYRHLQGRHPNRLSLQWLSLQWLSLCDHSMQWLSSRHHHLHGRRHPHRALSMQWLSLQGRAQPGGPSCSTGMLLHLLWA